MSCANCSQTCSNSTYITTKFCACASIAFKAGIISLPVDSRNDSLGMPDMTAQIKNLSLQIYKSKENLFVRRVKEISAILNFFFHHVSLKNFCRTRKSQSILWVIPTSRHCFSNVINSNASFSWIRWIFPDVSFCVNKCLKMVSLHEIRTLFCVTSLQIVTSLQCYCLWRWKCRYITAIKNVKGRHVGWISGLHFLRAKYWILKRLLW